jgi:hypothetical protein
LSKGRFVNRPWRIEGKENIQMPGKPGRIV